jgi:hypothetical protein
MAVNYNPSIVRSGLVLYLDAANRKSYSGAGTSWNDISGTGNNGTLVGGIAYTSSNAGTMTFDGTTGYIDCGTAPQIGSSLTGLTVSMWVNTNSRSVRCIAEDGTNYNTNTFYMFQEDVNYFSFTVFGTSYDVIYTNYVYQLNTWYNLVGTWQAGLNTQLYTNGVLTSGTRNGSAQNSVIDGNANLNIGTRPGNASFRFSGNMGPSMFYNRALTPLEIQQNFNAIRGRYGI